MNSLCSDCIIIQVFIIKYRIPFTIISIGLIVSESADWMNRILPPPICHFALFFLIFLRSLALLCDMLWCLSMPLCSCCVIIQVILFPLRCGLQFMSVVVHIAMIFVSLSSPKLLYYRKIVLFLLNALSSCGLHLISKRVAVVCQNGDLFGTCLTVGYMMVVLSASGRKCS